MSGQNGGLRPGSGRKRKGLADKVLEGNPSHDPILKMLKSQPLFQNSSVKKYLTLTTKDFEMNVAPDIYEATQEWLSERKCADIVNPDLVLQYAKAYAHYLNSEQGLAKHGYTATTSQGVTYENPFVDLVLKFSNQANKFWIQIFQIVKENSSQRVDTKEQQDIILQALLKGKDG